MNEENAMTKSLSTFYALLFTLVALLGVTLVSCEPDRGDKLDGKWLLEKKMGADGTVHAVDTVWYNFQNTLFMYQIYQSSDDTYHHIYGFKTWENDESILLELKPDPVSVESFLPFTDWATDTRSFSVDQCSGGKLILSSEGISYHFRRF